MTTSATAVLKPKNIQCKHCPASTSSSPEAARGFGWRMFRGESVTGKPLDDVVCPGCAGTASPEEKAEGPGWRVSCRTCHWEYEEEDDETLSPKEAKQVANDHECEPEVEIAPPAGDKWFDPFRVNDDGTIRDLS